MRLLGHPIISTSASLPDSPVESDPYEIEANFKPHLGLVIDGGRIPPAPSSIISLINDEPEIIREGKGPVRCSPKGRTTKGTKDTKRHQGKQALAVTARA